MDILAALRRIRDVRRDDVATFEDVLLRIALEVTSSARVTLGRGLEARVVVERGIQPDESATARLELRFPAHEREAILVFERAAPWIEDHATLAEIVGGDIVVRLEHARAERDGRRAARHLALLDSVTLARGDLVGVSGMADRVARELCDLLDGSHISMHILVDGRLELVARRYEDGAASLDEAPDWFRTIAIDLPVLQASVARERKCIARPIAELSEPARKALEPHDVRHLVVTPLVSGETVIGVLSVAHRHPTPWDTDQLRLLDGIATRLGSELMQIRILEDERRRSHDLALVNEIGSLVTRQLDLAAVLDTAVAELARVIGVPRASVMLADDERKMLLVAASTSPDKSLSVPVDGRFSSSHAFRTREPVVVEDALGDTRASPELLRTFGSRALLAVPLMSSGEAIGVIVLADQVPRRFTKDEVARATAVANLLSPAIANAKMFEDLRRSYEALARAQADLVTHERLAALGELSAVIAHEVRNPLAVIFNSLGSLQRLTPATPDAKLLLDIVAEEAARLNRIVADLLDFVRPYSSHPRPARLENLVRGAIDGARRALGGKTTIEADLVLGEDEIVLDGTMIQQALTNLIVNALQATGPDGIVIVRARSELGGPRPELRFEICDDGPGIDDEDAARIFQPFFTTKATGTGLGLAVVRRIADALGGTVSVTRGVTRGSVFTLTVPAHERS